MTRRLTGAFLAAGMILTAACGTDDGGGVREIDGGGNETGSQSGTHTGSQSGTHTGSPTTTETS